MKQYFDADGNEIRENMILGYPDGQLERVFRISNEDGEEDLGILATNPDYDNHHPDEPLEFYSLSAGGTADTDVHTPDVVLQLVKSDYEELLNRVRKNPFKIEYWDVDLKAELKSSETISFAKCKSTETCKEVTIDILFEEFDDGTCGFEIVLYDDGYADDSLYANSDITLMPFVLYANDGSPFFITVDAV